MKLLIGILLLCSLSSYAEEENTEWGPMAVSPCRENPKSPTGAADYQRCLARHRNNSTVNADQASECRQLMHTKRRIYVEEMERCQGVLLHDSLEKFNRFAERREPVVDCQEARENPGIVKACRTAGVAKVKAQGQAWGFTIRDQDVYACDVDNSHWVTSNYVWFCANSPRGEIRQLTQKPLWGDCF